MRMSKERKRLIGLLRYRFNWRSETNHNRGTLLLKCGPDDPFCITDISFYLADSRMIQAARKENPYEIKIGLHKYTKSGKTYKEDDSIFYLTFGELELLYQLVKEKKREIRINFAKEIEKEN